MDGISLVMIQIYMQDWNSLQTVKYGQIGEDIVNKYLISRGIIPYAPSSSGAHPFDRLCASKDKRRLFVAEIKTKPARIYYPDTGINISHYLDYKHIQEVYKIQVIIFFVDHDRKSVYGNYLSELETECNIEHNGKVIAYPLTYKGIIYFPLAKTIHVADIPDEEIEKLQILSSRNQDYSQVFK